MFKFYFFILIYLFCSPNIFGEGEKISSQVMSIEISEKKALDLYLKKLNSFSKTYCKGGVEEEFWSKYKNFRGNGNFIPLLPDGKLDKATVNRFIPEIEAKKKWIDSQRKIVEKKKHFKPEYAELIKLEKEFNELLLYKKKLFLSQTQKNKDEIRNNSKYKLISFRSNLKKYLESLSFLHSYKFPVDHFDLRVSYDKYKSSEDVAGKRKSNEVYFFRKIVQDGAQDINHKKSDRFLRATIDSIYLNLNKNTDFITEDFRFDMKATFDAIKWHLKARPRNQFIRLGEWSERVERGIEFYKMLRDGKVSDKGHAFSTDNLLQNRAKGRYILKDYVLKKEADSYKFWMNQSTLMQALYAIDTILFNEVGGLDGRDALERRDVTQVVINRLTDPEYNSIESDEAIFDYLKLSKEEIKKNPWLNVMFKEGEFSFTYFFIPGNLRIYCPDMTRNGKFLRRENISIALSLLQKPNVNFHALRYFSRASMLGRVNMAQIWLNFVPVAERPGLKVKRSNYLKSLFKKGKYEFLYDFKTEEGDTFQVIKFKKSTYVTDRNGTHFYKYRNRHYFRYFEHPL
ncbi:hypothetical protein [Halobacteriovorax sp. JY17]|uniref:hypothetical protein n=1 Tax=Halobacteriovorax sp. JY17 TaxID=2014617 RepID=UPI000C45102E|nr:hypothetical protein [Halobacteriovorax sp. JY17]PIK13865.1 MAG: hypothetical protein CES88_12830 [Halobacteriovorax sp. JY17]